MQNKRALALLVTSVIPCLLFVIPYLSYTNDSKDYTTLFGCLQNLLFDHQSAVVTIAYTVFMFLPVLLLLSSRFLRFPFSTLTLLLFGIFGLMALLSIALSIFVLIPYKRAVPLPTFYMILAWLAFGMVWSFALIFPHKNRFNSFFREETIKETSKKKIQEISDVLDSDIRK